MMKYMQDIEETHLFMNFHVLFAGLSAHHNRISWKCCGSTTLAGPLKGFFQNLIKM
jgi:hypothetical protein